MVFTEEQFTTELMLKKKKIKKQTLQSTLSSGQFESFVEKPVAAESTNATRENVRMQCNMIMWSTIQNNRSITNCLHSIW